METDPYSSPSSVLEGISNEQVAGAVIDQLARTKIWVRLIAVLVFIGALFMVGMGVFMGIGGGVAMMASRSSSPVGTGIGLTFMILYIVMAAIYIYPGIKLWAYANRIGALVRDRSSLSLEQALNEQRKFWKFCGIFAIVILALYGIFIVLAIVGFAVGAAASNA